MSANRLKDGVTASREYYESHPHLLDSARIELACDYLVHEFRKIFVEISSEDARAAINKEAPKPDETSDTKVCDFWNLFCAMSSTWRRKALHEIVTDQNVSWRKGPVTLDRLCPDTPQGWMQKFGRCEIYDFHQAASYLRNNETALQEAIRYSNIYRKNHGKGSENDPIIVVPHATCYRVCDGNGRLAIRMAQWITERNQMPGIEAWIGERNGPPKNRWTPGNSPQMVATLRNTIA